jgi:glycerate dehydrogenase
LYHFIARPRKIKQFPGEGFLIKVPEQSGRRCGLALAPFAPTTKEVAMKIVILDGYAENPGDLSWDALAELAGADALTVHDRTPAGQVAGRIGPAEIVLTNKTPISRADMEACPNLRYIGMLATGYNVVDAAAAAERGIPLCNIPTYGTTSVSQHTIALLLEVCHRAGHHSRAVHEGRWAGAPDWCFWDYPQIELSGKTMGVFGFGRIGQATGRIARAQGMEVIAYNRSHSRHGSDSASYVELDEFWPRADIIALHSPLFPELEGLINKDTISRMKDGVIIVNTARGQLINEADLAGALNSGKVYGAGLDVVSVEPIRPDNPLLGAKNCIITPHIAWSSLESRKRLMDTAVENLHAFLDGKPINVVNM